METKQKPGGQALKQENGRRALSRNFRGGMGTLQPPMELREAHFNLSHGLDKDHPKPRKFLLQGPCSLPFGIFRNR
jgi:hypothetical protein